VEQIGIFDAKTKFPEIIDRVNQTGMSIIVTNRGKPVAEISPVKTRSEGHLTRQEAFETIARLRRETPCVTKEEIREMIEEGRDRWYGV